MAAEYLASNEFPGDGVTTLYNVSFKGNRPDAGSGVVPYLNTADVKAQLITPATPTTAEVVEDVPIVYVGPNQFRVAPATPVGKIVRIYRATQDDYALVDYQSLQTVSEADLDLSNRQLVFIVQESRDLATRADVDATSAVELAYEAINTANDAATLADAANTAAGNAVGLANAAVNSANLAVSTANAASAAATSATTAANDALAAANSVVDIANGAVAAANAAQATAGGAANTANDALAVANGIAATADAALAAASTATATANNALSVANGIAGTAQDALDAALAATTTANAANSTANTALSTANGIAATANTALSTANTALSAANAAQPGDATLTAIAALTPVANEMVYFTGTDVAARTPLSAFARTLLDDTSAAQARATLGVMNVATDHISGLRLEYNGRRALTVYSGEAYVPGAGGIVTVASNISLTSIVFTANAHNFLYLYDSGGGVGAIEVSATVPTVYRGTAAVKTGDTSRRFIGAVKTSSASDMWKWLHDPVESSMIYTEGTPAGAPFVLVSGYSGGFTAVSALPVAPVQVTYALKVVTQSTGLAFYGLPEQQSTPGLSTFVTSVGNASTSLLTSDDSEVRVSRASATLGQFLVSSGQVAGSIVSTYCYGYRFGR